jgi:hypothetical protein
MSDSGTPDLPPSSYEGWMWLSLITTGIGTLAALVVPFCVRRILTPATPDHHGRAFYLAPVGWSLLLIVFAYGLVLVVRIIAHRGIPPKHYKGRLGLSAIILGFAGLLLFSRTTLPPHVTQWQSIANILGGKSILIILYPMVIFWLFNDSSFAGTWPNPPATGSLATIWEDVLERWINGDVVLLDDQDRRLRQLDALFAILTDVPPTVARSWLSDPSHWGKILRADLDLVVPDARRFVDTRRRRAARVRATTAFLSKMWPARVSGRQRDLH